MSAQPREGEVQVPSPVASVIEGLLSTLTAAHPPAHCAIVSALERDARALTSPELAYSETPPALLSRALATLRTSHGLERGGLFVDIGSGAGKVAFAASLLHEWDSVCGIEILPPLHRVALELLGRWDSPSFTTSRRGEGLPSPPTLRFLCADAASVDWATSFRRDSGGAPIRVLFINATALSDHTLSCISSICDGGGGGSWGSLPGCFAITLSKRLPSSAWDVIHESTHKLVHSSSTGGGPSVATLILSRKRVTVSPQAQLGITLPLQLLAGGGEEEDVKTRRGHHFRLPGTIVAVDALSFAQGRG